MIRRERLVCGVSGTTGRDVSGRWRLGLRQFNRTAEMNFQPKLGEHGGFDATGTVGLFLVGRVNNLDVVGLMSRHHLVARNALQDSVHDRPLGRGLTPPTLGLLGWELHHLGYAQITVKLSIHDKHPAPDDGPRSGNALNGAAAEPEVHGRLTLARRALPAADEMSWWGRARDEEDPDVIVYAVALIMLAPANIVQRILRGETQLAPKTIGNQAIQAGTLIHLVKMRQRLIGIEDGAGLCAFHGRTVNVVEQAFDQIAGWRQILQALLVLNANSSAAKVGCDADGGDVHLALGQHLHLGEFASFVSTEVELHPPAFQPGKNLCRLLIRDVAHGREEGGLAQPFLEYAGGVEQFVRYDGVVHSHATLVEHAENCFLLLESARCRFAKLFVCQWQLEHREVPDVALVVGNNPLAQPLAKAVSEEAIGEILAPKGAIAHSHFSERAVEIQHPDQPGPSATPVGDCKNRSLVSEEAGEQMLAILPDGFCDDQRGLRIELAKHREAHFLGIDETVLLLGVVRVGADDPPPFLAESGRERGLHFGLLRPALLIGGQAEIAVGDQIHLPRFERGRRFCSHRKRCGQRIFFPSSTYVIACNRGFSLIGCRGDSIQIRRRACQASALCYKTCVKCLPPALAGWLLALSVLATGCSGQNSASPPQPAVTTASAEPSGHGAKAGADAWPCYELRAAHTWHLNLPGGERFDASALLEVPGGDLLTVSDRGAGVYRIHFLTGTNAADLIRIPEAYTPAQLAPYAAEKIDRYDCEGLARDERGRLYICEEANRWILRWDPATLQVERLNIDWTPVRQYFSPTDNNASFEGIAVAGNTLYVANERQVGRLIAVDLRTLAVVDHFSVHPLGHPARDVHYSDLCWFDGVLWVLLRESRVVLKVDPHQHRVLAEYGYYEIERDPENAYRTWYPTGVMEGLVVNHDSIWLVTDNNGWPRLRYPEDHRPTLFQCPRPDR